MKTFKSFSHFSYVWVEVGKKVSHNSPSAFDHFGGCPQGVCCCEFLYLLGVGFFYSIDLLGWVVGLVIECYFIYSGFYYFLCLLFEDL